MRDHGARKAEARGAGFPCRHLMEASMAFKERVRKGSWMLFAKRRNAWHRVRPPSFGLSIFVCSNFALVFEPNACMMVQSSKRF